MTEDSTGRLFERVLPNILPYRATTARAQLTYDPASHDPFVPDELIAVRDSVGTPYCLAKITTIANKSITVQYYGCTQRDFTRAVFRPGWHLPNVYNNETQDAITLSVTQPAGTVPYTGVLKLDSLRQLLVARNLEFTASLRLRRKSQRLLAPMHDELFVFDK